MWDANAADASRAFWAAVRRAIREVRTFGQADAVEALVSIRARFSITTRFSTTAKDTLVSRRATIIRTVRYIRRTRSVDWEAKEPISNGVDTLESRWAGLWSSDITRLQALSVVALISRRTSIFFSIDAVVWV